MLFEMLILFIILAILMFILSIYTIEDAPYYSIAFVMLGMIFSVLCAYGVWEVDFLVVGYNASNGSTVTEMYNSYSYGDPYSYIFVLLFFIFVIMFMVAAFNSWKHALKTKGELDLKNKYR